MRYLVTALIVASSLVYACQTSGEDSEEIHEFQNKHPDYSLEYRSADLPADLYIRLFANPKTGKIIGYFKCLNSKESVKYHSSDISLIAAKGGHSNISDMESADGQSFTGHFDIINNHMLYKRTGLNGDLPSHYLLEISGVNKPVTFTIKEDSFQQYLQTYAMEQNIRIYDLVMDTAAQSNYQKNNGLNNFLHVDDMEISSTGANIRFQAYQHNDSIKLAVKIVNHSNHELLIQPDVFIIKLSGEILQPESNYTGEITLRKSDRFMQDFAYYPSQQIIQFEILKEAIQVITNDTKKNLFASNIKFQTTQQ